MEVIAVSGETLAKLHEDELHDMVERGNSIRDLKRFLANRIGYSRFRQRVFSEEFGELRDDMCLMPLPSVQVIVLNFHAPDEMAKDNLLCECEGNNMDTIEQLLRQPQDPNMRGLQFANQPIHIAAQHGHLGVVRLLLEAGADTGAVSDNRETALHMAAGCGHLEVVQLLLEAGADKDAELAKGETALYVAAEEGHFEVVRLLLEAGADTDAGKDGVTALHIAAQNGHLEVYGLLLEAGADQHAIRPCGTMA